MPKAGQMPPPALLLAVAALALGALLAPARAPAAPRPGGLANPADRLADLPVDPEAYDVASRCLRRPRAGTVALAAWLARNFRGTSWGIMRCERLGTRSLSLHAEGRALDWHLDPGDPADRRAARELIRLLLAPDRLGTPRALARRMGLQEIIWNCRIWYAGAAAPMPYRPCFGDGRRPRPIDPTIAHRDHVHLGLNRGGASLRTSFWRASPGRRPAATAGLRSASA
jgi:hypothetical protein